MTPFESIALVDVLVVLALLEVNRRHARSAEWVVKPLAALGFLAAALVSGALHSRFGSMLFAGLVLSFLGDVLLIPRTKKTFVFGLASFLLGHLAYAFAFVNRGVAWRGALAGATFTAVALVVVARWLLPKVDASMKRPVIAYMIVISAMVTCAAGTVAARGNAWLLVGALAFYLSDLAVARERFVQPSFTNRLWGLPLYFGAQLVLAWCAGQP